MEAHAFCAVGHCVENWAGVAERWSSGNIFASFGSGVRRKLGESGKSDGLESMRDIQEFLPDLEDMDADHDVSDL